jgi:hypothetical protein
MNNNTSIKADKITSILKNQILAMLIKNMSNIITLFMHPIIIVYLKKAHFSHIDQVKRVIIT